MGADANSLERLPEQVSVLSVICSPARTVCTFRVMFLVSGPQSGWYTSSKAPYKHLRPTANKYYEGKMKRTLNREVNMLEIA